jgi:DNA-binding XRE family transcriptional regulator
MTVDLEDFDPRGRKRRNGRVVCRLKKYRTDAALSFDRLAAATGVNKSTLYYAEQGQDLLLSNARRLADYLGVALDDLWPPAAGG